MRGTLADYFSEDGRALVLDRGPFASERVSKVPFDAAVPVVIRSVLRLAVGRDSRGCPHTKFFFHEGFGALGQRAKRVANEVDTGIIGYLDC